MCLPFVGGGVDLGKGFLASSSFIFGLPPAPSRAYDAVQTALLFLFLVASAILYGLACSLGLVGRELLA